MHRGFSGRHWLASIVYKVFLAYVLVTQALSDVSLGSPKSVVSPDRANDFIAPIMLF
jgi:hypothetical protein